MELVGSFEPAVTAEGEVKAVIPTGDPTSPVRQVDIGDWRCQRCHHALETDGQPTEPENVECPGCERQGPFEHVGGLTERDIQTALRADDLWYPPGDIDDAGFSDLWMDVRGYLKDHWDASEAYLYDGLTAYALSTWVRENLTFVPHLMLMGSTTGGKTRLLNTLARVSYRAHVSASATPASMFRLIDNYDVSYFVSEYHGLPYDTQRQLDAVVRAGQKRGEKVDRAEQTATGEFEPKSFDPFAHIAIATQFEPDDDIINRCIQVRSTSADREMPAVHDDGRARDLRNRLLFARFALLEPDDPDGETRWSNAEQRAYDYLAARDITGRTREKLLSLLTVAYVWERVGSLADFIDDVIKQDRTAAAESTDGLVVEAINAEIQDQYGDSVVLGAIDLPYGDICERYETITGVEMSPSGLGHVVSRLDLEKTRKSEGTVIRDPDLEPKLRALCEEFNLDWPETGEGGGQQTVDASGNGQGDPSDIESESQLVEEFVRGRYPPERTIDPSTIAGELRVDPEAAEHGLENLKAQGVLVDAEGEGYEVV